MDWGGGWPLVVMQDLGLHMHLRNWRNMPNNSWRRQINRDRIKGIKLRHINASCGTAAVHEVPQYMRYFFIPRVPRLVYCGLCTAAAMYMAALAAVHEPQYMRDKKLSCVLQLVYCGCCNTQGAPIHEILSRVLQCTAVPQYMRHCGATACRSSCRSSQKCAAIWVVLYCPKLIFVLVHLATFAFKVEFSAKCIIQMFGFKIMTKGF